MPDKVDNRIHNQLTMITKYTGICCFFFAQSNRWVRWGVVQWYVNIAEYKYPQ